MVLTSNGEVLTNNHVIDGATSIKVTDLGNGKTYNATVVGYDRTQDVAVIQLQNASGLQTVDTGDSSSVKVGEAVVGIGNAGGAGGTPSVAGGSVVATNQSITASDNGSNPETLQGLIQTNAQIQPGDSGGPLVNTSGKVIGMDTAASSNGLQTQAASSSTEAFSIPINQALGIASQIEQGHASSLVHIGTTAFLGVEVSATGSSGFGQTSSGVYVAGVASGSPAGSAGLVQGDTIVSVDGQTVSSPSDLSKEMLGLSPGDRVQIVYTDASGAQQSTTVTLGSGPPQ
jgi:S1-C subfamily serine protease